MSTKRLRVVGLIMSIAALAILGATILLGSQAVSAAPTTFHVAPGGACGGAPNCYGTIQAAVDAAADGDTIKVAEGTYTSTGSEVVYIDSAITLIGGYAITDWDQSDPETRPTIIDAQDAYRRGVYIDGTGVTTITLGALIVQNAKREDQNGAGIYVENANLRLQDSTVRYNANTEGAGGGGLYARDCTMVLTGNRFHENNAAGGGGLRVEGSSRVTIIGNSFLGNAAFFHGGMTLGGSTVATVRDNTFEDNFGGEGGGIGVGENVSVTLQGNTFLGNSTAIDMSRPGGGLLVNGGTVVATGNHFEENSAFDGAGIYVDDQDASVTLSENTFVRNHASIDGGQGGALYVNHGTVLVQGNTIQDNNAAGGGGIKIGGGTVTLNGNLILNNSAFFGGGLSTRDAVVHLTGNTFEDNFGGRGGGIMVDAGTVTLQGNTFLGNSTAIDMSRPGGGLLVGGGTVVATGNHFEENRAFDGAGIYVDNPDGSVTLSENTFVRNHASIDGAKGGALFVNHGTVLVQGNTIQHNDAASGGGIHIQGETVTLNGNLILGNTAFFGGGLSVGNAIVHLNGNTFRDNFGGRGGGILLWEDAGTVQMSGNAFYGNASNVDQGPGLLIQGGTVYAQNDLVADSAQLDGAAVSVWGGTLTAYHWTLVNNGSYALETDGGSAMLTNSLVVSHTLGGLWGAGTVADTTLFYNSPATCGGGATCTNNLSGDPGFLSGATGNYHIGSDSAAIDAGVDAGIYVDIDGQPRPAGEGFDIGADEFWSSLFLPLVMRNY